MKIFCIGLSRSGSMTLNEALETLGYRSLFVHNYEQMEENLSRYDAFTHTPLAAIYQELDRRFPNSLFILNIRERERWLQSLENQWTAKGSSVSKSESELRMQIYGTNHFNRETLGCVYDQHLANVSQHFKGREQSLLILDVCGGEGYEKLCPFLGKPVLAQPFPHQNSARSTFESPSQRLRLFLIRHLKAREIKQILKRILR